MAERRMFSAKVICSDAFMQLPKSAQALYVQICMRADDDGFLNNAGQVVKSSGAKPADLRILVNRRFLLEYPGGVIVVKHWRMANSLKRDRAKPPVYPDVAAKVYIKPNKSYTDHQEEGYPSLLEYKHGYLDGVESKRNPNGIQLESSWNPKRIEENRREEKGREGKGIEGASDSGAESAPPSCTTPEQIVQLFFQIRKETVPDPIPGQLLDKAATLLAHGVTDDDLRTVFTRSTAGFLAGANRSGWRANLGWLLDWDNFCKVLSGQYENTGGGSWAQTQTVRVQAGTAAIGELERQAIARMLAEAEQEENNGQD